MPAPFFTEIQLASPGDTADLAKLIAPRLRPGDVLLLEGPIGAGKSHFARALIQARLAAAGLAEDVPSPTYTLVQSYDDSICEILHADLYRLVVLDEVEELGLMDAFEAAICLVEWPDRLGELAPQDALTLAFSPGPTENSRILSLRSADTRWRVLTAP